MGSMRYGIAGVLFQDWGGEEAASVRIDEQVASAAPYQPGRFYLRELPHILSLLAKLPSPPLTTLVDGYVYLDEAGRKGLGGHLFEALDESTPIIGVAKNPFAGSDHAHSICRGASRRPLFVTLRAFHWNKQLNISDAWRGHIVCPRS